MSARMLASTPDPQIGDKSTREGTITFHTEIIQLTFWPSPNLTTFGDALQYHVFSALTEKQDGLETNDGPIYQRDDRCVCQRLYISQILIRMEQWMLGRTSREVMCTRPYSLPRIYNSLVSH